MEKEQIEKAAKEYAKNNWKRQIDEKMSIKEINEIVFEIAANWALSQPTTDLDVMAQYRKDLESMPIVGLEQKPVESDAVSIKIRVLKDWIDRIETYEFDLKTDLFLKEDIEKFLPPIQTK